MTLHLYTAKAQPATRFVVDVDLGEPWTVEYKPRSLVRCWRCNRRRWAERCVVQAYYDGARFWCRDVKQCKKVKAKR